jgi:hypothetical protein
VRFGDDRVDSLGGRRPHWLDGLQVSPGMLLKRRKRPHLPKEMRAL